MWLTPYNFQGLVYRPRDDRLVADLDDGPIEQAGVGDDCQDYFFIRRVYRQAEFLELRLFLAK